MNTLTPTQAEILKLFQSHSTEKDLHELKNVLSRYLAEKVVREVDKEFLERGYTGKDIEKWKSEHNRKKES